jgi:hypothetical protein
LTPRPPSDARRAAVTQLSLRWIAEHEPASPNGDRGARDRAGNGSPALAIEINCCEHGGRRGPNVKLPTEANR